MLSKQSLSCSLKLDNTFLRIGTLTWQECTHLYLFGVGLGVGWGGTLTFSVFTIWCCILLKAAESSLLFDVALVIFPKINSARQNSMCLIDAYMHQWMGALLVQISNDYPNQCWCQLDIQAPVPLSIFRSNSKFDENSKHSSVKYTRPITTIFCTRHDSVTVVTCAKYRCDRSSIFETRAFWIFIEFRIRSKYA